MNRLKNGCKKCEKLNSECNECKIKRHALGRFTIGEKIAALRKKTVARREAGSYKLKIDELAHFCDVEPATALAWEHDEIIPTFLEILRISDFFRVDPIIFDLKEIDSEEDSSEVDS